MAEARRRGLVGVATNLRKDRTGEPFVGVCGWGLWVWVSRRGASRPQAGKLYLDLKTQERGIWWQRGKRGGAKGKLPTTTDWWQRGEGKKLPPNAHNMAFVLGRHKQGGENN